MHQYNQTPFSWPYFPQDGVSECWGSAGVLGGWEEPGILSHSFLSLSVKNSTCRHLFYLYLILSQSSFIKTHNDCIFQPHSHTLLLTLRQTLVAGPGATQGHTSTSMLHLPVLRHMITGGCPKGVHRRGKHANWGLHGGREHRQAEQGARVKGIVSKW